MRRFVMGKTSVSRMDSVTEYNIYGLTIHKKVILRGLSEASFIKSLIPFIKVLYVNANASSDSLLV